MARRQQRADREGKNHMARPFISAVLPPTTAPRPAWWFAFQGNQILVTETENGIAIPLAPDLAARGLAVQARHYLGTLGEVDCYAVDLDAEAPLPAGMALSGLRPLYGRVDEDLFSVAGRAVQIVEWDRTHRYCGRCGTPTELLREERAKKCPQCGLLSFPRLSPAVIMLVERGDAMLLGRGRNFSAPFYSTLAGFVEPGESLEEAVVREIYEEAGILVDNLRYFGSQPWPYPHSLMIGFTASYAGGTIRIQESELIDADWFTADNLPLLSQPPSIARRMIDAFLARHPAGGRGS
jgi:NAD+ diphosphatase